ncbi:MAG: phage holin family protein [Methylacidiphilales bacterium]|nr:phage holin family protein [Candidatus Methylacidiphilales bacterium]
MSVPEGIGPGSPGLFASLRSFWSVLLAILYTRLDLVTAELQDEAVWGIRVIVAGLISLICLASAFFWAMFFVLALFWDTEYRLWVLGGIFGIYFILGVVLFFIARNMVVGRPKFLSQTIAELRRDVEELRQAIATKKDEAKP